MTTGWVKPNENGSLNEWISNLGGAHYTNVDEYPDAPDDPNYVYYTEVGGGSERFKMTTIEGIADNSITQIVVYSYGKRVVTPCKIDISFDNESSWEGQQDCNLPQGTSAEVTNTWSGLSYSKSDLDYLVVRYDGVIVEKYDGCTIDRVYAVVTYTEAMYEHDFMGVPSANIASVSGVPSANIASIKGV